MLNDIRLHLDSDESLQRAHELALTRTIDALKEANTQAFEKYIPSIGKILPQLPFERLSIFADKDSQSNIVDFNTGRTLYARHPDKHIKEQVASWHYHSALLDLSEQNELDALNSNIKSTLNHTDISFEQSQHQAKQLYQALLAKGADTLVMLGLGKALQLDYLFDETSNQHFPHKGIKHLVIYEPDWEIFRCSLSVFNWSAFLENAASVGLQIYMQIGSDLSQLDKEIDELRDAYGAKRILFYQHLNLPMYSAIIDRIRNNSWGKGSAQIKQLSSHQQHFLHVFSAIDSNNWTSANRQTPLFVKNMALFKEYYPEIHDAYEAYQGQIWETITHKHSGQINLFNKAYKTYFSSSEPLQEAQALSQHFNQYPNLDGLVFGHSGDKLKHYAHNTFIRQTDVVLRQTQEQSGQLPKEVKCLLVFGLGTGYQLAHLAKQNNIHNLVICEPNPDMFYASLHAIDWAPIFNAIEESDCQLYINIGEASSVLFKDLMSQFLQIGPHVLNETYIMQAYHNPMLDQVLTEVRQQLKVIFFFF